MGFFELEPEKERFPFSKRVSDLEKITSGTWAVDFETTGLKPHAKGHTVICAAFSNGEKTSCTLIDGKTLPQIQRILADPGIKKVVHNLRFEDSWARNKLGVQVQGWYWDTMLAAHCIDNRARVRLKEQVSKHFGISGYEDEVAPYLKTKSKNANAINDIRNAPVDLLLMYCAQDAYYTFKLYQEQRGKTTPGFKFFMQGAQALSLVEDAGICLDVPRIQQQRREQQLKLAELKQAFFQYPAVLKWQQENGKDFNYNSPPQLRSFFKGIGEKFTRKTEKGADSADKDALKGFRHPVAKLILQIRAVEKLEGNYLANLEAEQVDGVLRPFFSLHGAATYRSSSSNPNFQNFPIRDPEAARIIRGNFKPRSGRQLLEVDYSGIEVRIAACYNGDPNLIKYIQDPTTDMHRDVAALIFKIKPEDVPKDFRQFAKGGFVFPAFYGSYYVLMAAAMWRDMTKEMRSTLLKSGIKTSRQFEQHIQKIEEHFWGVRFRKYAEWKKRQWVQYERIGYIESHTGFRYTGRMNRKEVSNYPIQGSAFHCLLWSLIQIQKWLRDTGKNSLIIGTIHDSVILDVVPEEKEEVKRYIRQVSCEDIRKHWDWIRVPLDIDAKISAVDGSWYEMEPEEI